MSQTAALKRATSRTMPPPQGSVTLKNRFDSLDIGEFPEMATKKRFCGHDDFVIVNNKRYSAEPKFLIMSHANEELNLNRTSPFLIQKGLDMIATDLKQVKRLRNGTLLIETKNGKQSEHLLKAKTLGGILPVKVEFHPYLNTSKGVVYSPDLIDIDEKTIQSELASQKVREVNRIKRVAKDSEKDRADDDGFIRSPLLIITFDTSILPKEIKAGYLNIAVKPYIPNPMRCKHCQIFGHTKKRCSAQPACAKCSEIDHNDDTTCANSPKCANCAGNHEAFRRTCPEFIREYEISKIKTIDRIPYNEAKKKYERSHPNSINQNKTYALQVIQPRNSNENHSQKNKEPPQAASSSSTIRNNFNIQHDTNQQPITIQNKTQAQKSTPSTQQINTNTKHQQKNEIGNSQQLTPDNLKETDEQLPIIKIKNHAGDWEISNFNHESDSDSSLENLGLAERRQKERARLSQLKEQQKTTTADQIINSKP